MSVEWMNAIGPYVVAALCIVLPLGFGCMVAMAAATLIREGRR